MASVENPLLQDFTFPPFDVIEPHHISPGIQSLLIKLEDDLVELEKTVEPTWPKLAVPLEKITDRLYGVWGLVYHLQTVKDSPELRAAVKEIQPKKVDFELKSSQSKPIYEAFKAIRDSSDWQNLSNARKRVVELRLRDVDLNGVSLKDARRQRFNEIEQLRYASVDLELHSSYAPGGPESIYDVDQRIESHAAGYYCYQALRKMGSKFRETILAYGGGKAPSEVYLQFRGRGPTHDAFLHYNGLLLKVAVFFFLVQKSCCMMSSIFSYLISK